MPLRQANTELSEKSGMLQVEKKLLEEEIKRWKARTQVCVETKRTAVGLVVKHAADQNCIDTVTSTLASAGQGLSCKDDVIIGKINMCISH